MGKTIYATATTRRKDGLDISPRGVILVSRKKSLARELQRIGRCIRGS